MRLLLVHRLLATITVGALTIFATAQSIEAQTTGRLMGRVLDAADSTAVAGARISLPEHEIHNVTNQAGRFVLVGVPVGRHVVQVDRLGYLTHRVEGVMVSAGEATELSVLLSSTALLVEGITVETARRRLIETEVVSTRETVLGTELRMLPIDAIDQAIELVVGVTEGGHFRGGRVGQDVQVVDGLSVKNPLEASTAGSALEFSPTSIEALEVTTGGFGAEYGETLSGVVNFTTRRGPRDAWFRELTLLSDQLTPSLLSTGHTRLTFSMGGPVPFLGENATLFADVLAAGMVDAEPRARGLTCLRPRDLEHENRALLEVLMARREPVPPPVNTVPPEEWIPGMPEPDPEDQDLVEAFRIAGDIADPGFHRLLCAANSHRIPNQRGDKLIAFARLDRPLAGGDLHLKLLRSRDQSELYTAPFLFNPRYQLGTRSVGHLAVLGYERVSHDENTARRTVLRTAYTGSDRYLGVVDPWTFDERFRILSFGPRRFRFVGEDFVNMEVNDQILSSPFVPGYEEPEGQAGSPFSMFGKDLFYTRGTPSIANWTRTHGGAIDLLFEASTADGNLLRLGASARRYLLESYERPFAHDAGERFNFARFYPTTASAFAEMRLYEDRMLNLDIGVRGEGFNVGLPYLEDPGDVFSSEHWSEWRVSVMPRIGIATSWPDAEDRTMFRLNWSRVSQPPDFQFFLDTTLGDSLRVDIERQGDPNLGFESGSTYEFSATHLIRDGMAASVTVFHKNMRQLISGHLQFPGQPTGQFTTGDYGRVNGIELRLRGGWDILQLRGGYALQKATGLGSTALDTGSVSIFEAREYPLAFDRRHVLDMTAMAGAAATADRPWSITATGTIQSGLPLDRFLASGHFLAYADTVFIDRGTSSIIDVHTRLRPPYLPWTAVVNMRASYDLPWHLGCDRRKTRVFLDGRNLLGLDNVRALRPDNAQLSPDLVPLLLQARTDINAMKAAGLSAPIPRESPKYSRYADLDGDGYIGGWVHEYSDDGEPPELKLDDREFVAARLAALMAVNDPSLYFGPQPSLRLGIEVRF